MLYEYGHQYFILKHSNVSLSLLELELWKLAVSIHSKDRKHWSKEYFSWKVYGNFTVLMCVYRGDEERHFDLKTTKV